MDTDMTDLLARAKAFCLCHPEYKFVEAPERHAIVFKAGEFYTEFDIAYDPNANPFQTLNPWLMDSFIGMDNE